MAFTVPSHLGGKVALKIFSRQRCGLRPPSRGYARQSQVNVASIHHGGEVGGPRWTFASGKATWQSWQSYHMGKGWTDIAYQFGVDGRGRLYEGRPPWAVPAAVEGHNTNSIGIVFMQDGDKHGLTVLQRRTLKELFEKGIPEKNVPPLKSMKVAGHKEFSGHYSNACPGERILRHLKWRRSRYQ
jgi:N-acetylmuramoyl-L-alanine amidase